MKYRVVLVQSAQKEFNKAPRNIQEKVLLVFGALETNPYSGKPLRGEYAGVWTMRAWPFRVIYEIIEAALVVTVIRVRHRKDAYR